MNANLFIAVDLGAGSGRVFLGNLSAASPDLEEVYRFQYPPRHHSGALRWDFESIFAEILRGLGLASEKASSVKGRVTSIGVDTWGVDYGWIDVEGRLISDPVCYRDKRTEGMIEKVTGLIPRSEMYGATGIQFLPFNTIFQLFSEKVQGEMPAGCRALLMPDLIGYRLTGKLVSEYSNSTTMQLVDARTRDWAWSLIDRLGLRRDCFPIIAFPGDSLGKLKPAIASQTGLEDVQVVLPATHDTGSAVAGAPLRPGSAYISSGTWSLVGVELDAPLITEVSEKENFTNEGGADGTIRFLKNVAGLWLLESCRREWKDKGIDISYDSLLADASSAEVGDAVLFPDDPRFFNPLSMIDAIGVQLSENGFRREYSPGQLTRIILESLALRYASIIKRLELLTGQVIERVCVVGGGSQNDFLNQATADYSGRLVTAGPVEATVLGNLLVQGIAAGRFANLAEARRYSVASSVRREYSPQVRNQGQAAAYSSIEAAFQV